MKKRMTQAQFQQIRRWVLRNGRPLEWARWQAMFEGGSQNQAAEVLSGYQNAQNSAKCSRQITSASFIV